MKLLKDIILVTVVAIAYCPLVQCAISPELLARDDVFWNHQRSIDQWYSEGCDWSAINERYRMMIKIELEWLNSLSMCSSEQDATRQALEELYRYLERHSIEELKQYIDRKIVERCLAP